MEILRLKVDVPADNGGACHICAKILSLYKAPFDNLEWVELGKVSEVLDSECPHAKWVRNAIFDKYGTVSGFLSCGLDANKGNKGSTIVLVVHHETQEEIRQDGLQPFNLVAKSDNLGRSRILDPEWIDLDVVRGWYSRCIDEHGLECDRPTWIHDLDLVRPEWVIDTVDSCITPADIGMKYLSLSYTWGQTTNLKTTTRNLEDMRQPGALAPGRELWSVIPETIRNACQITRILGERYLWVDSLCIVQDEEVSRTQSLQNMHKIYANSVLCLVAMAGENADFGLRGIEGISQPRFSNQFIVDIADGEKLAGRLTDRHPTQAPQNGRSYHERAWTYQEFIFAKRRLIFQDGPIRWHCKCAGWNEELISHSAADAYKSTAPELHLSSRWMKARTPDLSTVMNIINDYNRKTLTYPEDVLPAFSGIQSTLNEIYPGGFLFGHPEFFFEQSLVWYNPLKVTRRRPSDKFQGDPMKDNLPSWSWMGWRGVTWFPGDMENCTSGSNDGFQEPVTTWSSMETPISSLKTRINSQWFSFKQAAKFEPETPPQG